MNHRSLAFAGVTVQELDRSGYPSPDTEEGQALLLEAVRIRSYQYGQGLRYHPAPAVVHVALNRHAGTWNMLFQHPTLAPVPGGTMAPCLVTFSQSNPLPPLHAVRAGAPRAVPAKRLYPSTYGVDDAPPVALAPPDPPPPVRLVEDACDTLGPWGLAVLGAGVVGQLGVMASLWVLIYLRVAQ